MHKLSWLLQRTTALWSPTFQRVLKLAGCYREQHLSPPRATECISWSVLQRGTALKLKSTHCHRVLKLAGVTENNTLSPPRATECIRWSVLQRTTALQARTFSSCHRAARWLSDKVSCCSLSLPFSVINPQMIYNSNSPFFGGGTSRKRSALKFMRCSLVLHASTGPQGYMKKNMLGVSFYTARQ